MAHGMTSRDVPYLSKNMLELQAALLLHAYGDKHGQVATPPIPIDSLLENFLKLQFSFMDLKAAFGFDDVDGALWMDRGEVGVDHSLDPDANPRKEGRYNFTLAHEVGHWQLHRRHRLKPRDPLLPFAETESVKPTYVCRSSTRSRSEWQANYFASALLMPKPMIQAQWRGLYGDSAVTLDELRERAPEIMDAESRLRRHWFPRDEDQFIMCLLEWVARPLASVFRVSLQAMRIRLEQLDLLLRERPVLLS